MINPTVILQQRIQQASEVAITAMRCDIHSSRANKFKKIDLRKLKAYPEKKARIRAIIWRNHLIARALLTNMIIISSQQIQTKSFAKGSEMVHINYKK